MEVVIIVGEDGIAEVRGAGQESERGPQAGGMSVLRRSVLPNLERLRDEGPDWGVLRDLNDPFKW